MTFTCTHCDIDYKTKYSLQRHLFKVHIVSDDNAPSSKTSRILCSLCNLGFFRISNYHSHLKNAHNVSLNTETLKFSNTEEFQDWKVNLEKETTCMFVQTTSAKKSKTSVVYYFFCHRSFLGKTHKRKTANKKKHAGSNKMNKSCPAMMKAVVTDSAVQVEFCSTHLGHDFDVGRLRLTAEDRNLIAGKLSAGEPPRRVLANIKQNAPSENLYRIHYTNMSDLYNIKRSFGIACPLRYDNNDLLSVESWIKKKENLPEADNPVLFYKNQNSDYENFEKSDFILILMTKFQKQMLLQFGDNVVCVDRTHGLNDYNFQLFTILVQDEHNEGIPVAFCFSNRSTKELYKLFFTKVKETIDESVTPNVFMSDGETSSYTAWKDVMSPATHQLIYRWHLNKVWATNLNKITHVEKRNLVLQTLNSLVMEQDPDTFTSSLQQFLIRLKSDNDTFDFFQYFQKNFVHNVAIWAQCYNLDTPIDTNMGLEALHKNIKYNHLNGTRCIRLDKTINALMCLVQDKHFKRIIKFSKQKPSKKLARIKASHDQSIDSETNVEKIGEGSWLVQSSTNPSQGYQINQVKYTPCCVHICKKCKICLHMITCSCYDYSVNENICKHIHAVMRLQQKQKNDNVVSEEEVQNIDFCPNSEQNNFEIEEEFDQLRSDEESEQEEVKNNELLVKISAIYDDLQKTTLNSEQLSGITKHLDSISALISSTSKGKTQSRIEIIEQFDTFFD